MSSLMGVDPRPPLHQVKRYLTGLRLAVLTYKTPRHCVRVSGSVPGVCVCRAEPSVITEGAARVSVATCLESNQGTVLTRSVDTYRWE